MARQFLGITASSWMLSWENSRWVGRQLESQLKLIQAEILHFFLLWVFNWLVGWLVNLLHLIEIRARKEEHVLATLHRCGLWCPKARLEPNSYSLSWLHSPFPLCSLVHTVIFLFPLQTICAYPISLLLPRCLFLLVQHFLTSVVPWGQLKEINWMQPKQALVSYSDFPDVQGRQGNGADSGAALRKIKFHLGFTWFSVVPNSMKQSASLKAWWAWGGLNACFGSLF